MSFLVVSSLDYNETTSKTTSQVIYFAVVYNTHFKGVICLFTSKKFSVAIKNKSFPLDHLFATSLRMDKGENFLKENLIVSTGDKKKLALEVVKREKLKCKTHHY